MSPGAYCCHNRVDAPVSQAQTGSTSLFSMIASPHGTQQKYQFEHLHDVQLELESIAGCDDPRVCQNPLRSE